MRVAVMENTEQNLQILKASKQRSRTALFCQALSTQFYRKPRDSDIHRYRRTAPMRNTVF